MVTEASWKNWKPEDFKPYLDVVFEAFSANRLMFGSDWPVCLLAANYRQVFELVSDYVRQFPAGTQEKIFGENAAKCYGLGEATTWTCS
jgi:L-fuconolactonase